MTSTLRGIRRFPAKIKTMSSLPPKSTILEGVLAVNKPTGLTSSDVLHNLQAHFNTSPLFEPHLASVRAARASEPRSKARNKRDKQPVQVKIGHGGTLDPLATGVLIAGIGNGTKSLQKFLACTKSYETVVGFGVESDTYDVLGKVTRTAGSEGVTAESIKAVLAKKFKGTFMQTPPAYSARRVNGKRLYDLARQGEVPKEALQEKEVDVTEMELVEFWETGNHDFVMKTEDREAFAKAQSERRGKKRKHWRGEEEAAGGAPQTKTVKTSTDDAPQAIAETTLLTESILSGAVPIPEETLAASNTTELKQEGNLAELSKTDGPPSLGPAARIRMTVTSGFYVRSLCHDLAKELGSAGVMAELVRTRQGEFELGINVLEYDDMEKGEEVWGPKVKSFLEDWQAREAKRQSKE